MTKFLICIFFIAPSMLYGQDTTYHDVDGALLKSKTQADYFKVVLRDFKASNKVTIRTYYSSGKIRSEYFYADYKNSKQDGPEKK